MTTLQAYYRVVKPGIIYGNALPLLAGYILATGRAFDPVTCAAALSGQSLVIAGACVYNNVMDRQIDRRMQRTAKRAIVTGAISVRRALLYATLLTLAGLLILLFGTNILTTLIGLTGTLLYVLAYGWAKRHSSLGTLIGSVPGALPAIAGYTAGLGRIDATCGILFMIFVCWQMPHFYAISLFRLKDYSLVGLPLLAVRRPAEVVRRHIIFYVTLFTAACLALVLTAPLGWVYALAAIVSGLYWLGWGIKNRKLNTDRWARQMFGKSLLALLLICAAIGIGRFLP